MKPLYYYEIAHCEERKGKWLKELKKLKKLKNGLKKLELKKWNRWPRRKKGVF